MRVAPRPVRTLRAVGLAALALIAAPGAVLADQTDPRLGALFAALRTPGDPQHAQLATLQIWQIWYETENQEARDLIQAGEREVARGRFDDALALFDRLVAIAPDFAEGWNRRATVLYLLGDYPASIRDCHKVLALEPRHFGALSGLAEMHRRRGEDRAALDAYERLLAINPYQEGSRDAVRELRDKLQGRPL